MTRVHPDVLQDLAPLGILRAAINYGNPILASRDPVSQEPRGVSVDLARELARRLGVDIELVPFEAAGKVVDAAPRNVWDVAFIARDPLRAQEVDQTQAYLRIEGAYLVRDHSTFQLGAEVDRVGVCVVVGAGSAYDLFLTRTLKHAHLFRTTSSATVVDTMAAQAADEVVAAGVRQQLEADAKRWPGLRMLPGSFMSIEQAMGTPKGRAAGALYLQNFVRDSVRNGLLARLLLDHGIEGVTVAAV